METSILVTVCCLTYNHEKYIRDCLEGIVMQRVNFNYEILIHDDASTDNTQNIIKEYIQKYPNLFKAILQVDNQYSKGISPLRQILFPKVRGKYIALCEGDDYWTDANKLQKQVDFLEVNQEYGLVYTDLDIKFEDKNTFNRDVFKTGYKTVVTTFEEHLLNAGYIAPCTWLYRREFIHIVGNRNYVDSTFPLALDIMACSKVYYMSDTTSVYRVLEESASHSTNFDKKFNFIKGILFIQIEYIEKYSNLINRVKVNRYISKKIIKLIIVAFAKNQKDFIKETVLINKSIKSKKIYLLTHLNNRFLIFFSSIIYKLNRLLKWYIS